MWINTIRQGLFDKYKIISQLQIHCSGVWHIKLPTCRVVWIPANLGKIWLWGCVNLWSVSQVSEGTKILSEEAAGWWCTVSTDTMFHMIVPIFLCLTLYTTEQGGIGPERLLTLHFEISEPLEHWEWWAKTKLRLSLCFTALERGKKRTLTLSPWVQTHI